MMIDPGDWQTTQRKWGRDRLCMLGGSSAQGPAEVEGSGHRAG